MTAVSRIKITNRQSIIVSTVGSVMVEIRGLEPLASALRTPRYTNLAISPRQIVFYNKSGAIARVLLRKF